MSYFKAWALHLAPCVIFSSIQYRASSIEHPVSSRQPPETRDQRQHPWTSPAINAYIIMLPGISIFPMDAGLWDSKVGRCRCLKSGAPCTEKAVFFLRWKKWRIPSQISKIENKHIKKLQNSLNWLEIFNYWTAAPAGKILVCNGQSRCQNFVIQLKINFRLWLVLQVEPFLLNQKKTLLGGVPNRVSRRWEWRKGGNFIPMVYL